MKSRITIITAILFSVALTFSACKKDDPKPPAETCSDGIQNQGETGVDCGGPCTACKSDLCDGKGDDTYFPLTLNNQWKYTPTLTLTAIEQLTLANSKSYFSLKHTGQGWTGGSIYLRKDTNGDIYEYNMSLQAEYLYIPANPTVGQIIVTYPAGPSDSLRRVIAVNETVTTANCTYTGVLKIESMFKGGGEHTRFFYYKKGVGNIMQQSFYAGIDLGAETINGITLK